MWRGGREFSCDVHTAECFDGLQTGWQLGRRNTAAKQVKSFVTSGACAAER